MSASLTNKYQKLSDKALVDTIIDGDHNAFQEILIRYQSRIYHLIKRFIDDPGDANDLSQEVFIKAFKHLTDFRADSSLYTWLYKITLNTVKNHYRFYAKRVGYLDLDYSQLETSNNMKHLSEFDDPEKLLMCDELSNKLQKAIDSLPEQLGQCLYLRELKGLSYEDIAKDMHCPVGTVRSRIHRARHLIETIANKNK